MLALQTRHLLILALLLAACPGIEDEGGNTESTAAADASEDANEKASENDSENDSEGGADNNGTGEDHEANATNNYAPSEPAEPSRAIALEPDVAVDFGDVAPGDSEEKTFTITGAGDLDLTIQEVALVVGEAYSLVEAPEAGTILSPTESTTIVVRFSPSEPRPASAQLIIRSDADAYSEIVLPLSANAPCLESDPFLLDFGPLAPGATAVMPIALSNCSPVVEHEVDLALHHRFADDTEVFFLVDPQSPRTLAPGETTNVEVEFRPYRSEWEGGDVAFRDGGYEVATRLVGNRDQ